jgi:uncharacterized membrane protein
LLIFVQRIEPYKGTEMAEYRKTNRKDWTGIILRLVVMFLVMFTGVALLGPGLLFLWPVVFLVPLGWIILWHTLSFAYRCLNCRHTFEISFWHNMLTPHSPDGRGGGWKYVRCPHCKDWTKAEVLRIVKHGR